MRFNQQCGGALDLMQAWSQNNFISRTDYRYHRASPQELRASISQYLTEHLNEHKLSAPILASRERLNPSPESAEQRVKAERGP
jgi:hypothetical protein